MKDCGFTLIEVITTIVVVGIASTALLSVFSSTIKTSADPMLEQQAIAIAEAYMEEIMLKALNDPGGPVAETRATYDDVMDYNVLVNAAIEDQNGDPIPALAKFNITVAVSNVVLNTVPASLIDITVTHAAVDPVVLSGYRMIPP